MEKRRKKGVSETATMADGNVSTNQATVVSDTPHDSAGIEKIVATPAETYKKEALPETATIANDSVSTKKAPVVSGNACADTDTKKVTISPANARAKVIKNLDFLIHAYLKHANDVYGFISNLSRALYLQQHESSQYGFFTLPDGKRITLRISNHNAKVSTFDRHYETEGLSIVISSFQNKRINNDGYAHITEYFYPRRKIETATNKPLATILLSVKNLLLTGEYIDTTGLAEKQEVNPRCARNDSGAKPPR